MELAPLKPEELDAHIAGGTLRLAFIGMSNTGKSYRSRVLASELDFSWYHVDGEIQKELGFDSMDKISTWLGYPSSATYKEREAAYLNAENACTMVDDLEVNGKNLVFDTTGSVINLATDTLTWLKEQCLLVHLSVDEAHVEELLERFFEHPKPLIWGEHFSQKENESEMDALRRCYPALLHERLAQYNTLSHINIPAEELYDKTGAETIALIREQL